MCYLFIKSTQYKYCRRTNSREEKDYSAVTKELLRYYLANPSPSHLGGRAATTTQGFTVEIGHLHGYEGGRSGQSHPENADPDQRVDKHGWS